MPGAMVQGIENLAAAHEYRTGAGKKQQIAPDTGILVQIFHPPVNRTDGKGVNDPTCLKACSDLKQAANPIEHMQSRARFGPHKQKRRFP